MTPGIVTLREVMRHHEGLTRDGRAFCEALLAQGDVLGVALDYFPESLLWLVSTAGQAQMMRHGIKKLTDLESMVLSLREAEELLACVGDRPPATLYEVAERLRAPAPEEPEALPDASDQPE